MLNRSFQHLKEANESYVTHGSFALKWGFFLIFTGIISILHGIVPALFPFQAPKNVLRVARLIQERNRPNENRE